MTNTKATPQFSNKPIYAVAGAADAAIDALRELPSRIVSAATDPEFRAKLRSRFESIPADAKALKGAPGKAGELPDRFREFVSNASDEAVKSYDAFAARGRSEHGDAIDSVVSTIRQRFASAADDVADAAEHAADNLRDRRK